MIREVFRFFSISILKRFLQAVFGKVLMGTGINENGHPFPMGTRFGVWVDPSTCPGKKVKKCTLRVFNLFFSDIAHLRTESTGAQIAGAS